MGPLAGIVIIEIASIGPGPMCAMLLADLGADVIRVDRIDPSDLGVPVPRRYDVMARRRRSIALDLRKPGAADVVLRLLETADGLIEGFRPGVMERLGIGPTPCLACNPRLVYGRMTGFGQTGPLAGMAGHDINYIALNGTLNAIGRAGERPVPPLNLVGDYGGGALYLALGMVAGLLNAQRGGRGDVIDAAMVDGAASLMTTFAGLRAMGSWSDERGVNILDGGAPWYDTYTTQDGLFMAVGAIEPKFFRELARLMGLDHTDIERQHDRAHWPTLRAKMTALFLTRTRTDWTAIFEGTDACVTPVLSLAEAPAHPHLAARATFETNDGVTAPAAAPRFTHASVPPYRAAPERGAQTMEILRNCGYSESQINDLRDAAMIA